MYRKKVVFSVVNSKLLFKIFKRVKRMHCIEIFVAFAVRTFDFPVVPRHVRFDDLVLDSVRFESFFKQCWCL